MAPLAAAPARALVFIGFMGSGKSTAAAQAASAIGVEALDSDRLLEAQLGHTIAEEFSAHGEAAFRAREEQLVLDLLARAGAGDVLALGGGSVLSERVRNALAPHLVILLEIAAASAWERVHHGSAERPLAREYAEFVALHGARRPVYDALADAILPGERDVATRALPALSLLTQAPHGARMVWARSRSGEYPAVVGRGLLAEDDRAQAWRAAFTGTRCIARGDSRAYCVSDQTVSALYGDRLGAAEVLLEIAPGEQHKTLASAEYVWHELARTGMTRADHVVALGGGVVGDLAGFCAATYQRGVAVVHLPTTLVAQVDSAYGGKTGVDLPEAKNYVGAYHQPAAVLSDPDVLATLPQRELQAGWVEVLKTALIAGGELWRAVSADEPLNERMILDCVRTKLQIVAEDERDVARRQLLNLGHTVGHAIESATGYGRYRHGEAVGLGLLATLELSGQDALRSEVRALLEAHSLPLTIAGASATEILAAAAYDKKRLTAAESTAGNGPVAGGSQRTRELPPFVLVDGPGSVRFGVSLGEAEVRQAIERLLAP